MIRKTCTSLLSLALLVLLPAQAVPTPAVEYQVKASLVFNFMHFVEWPEETFKNHSGDIAVCLIGRDVYGNALRVLQGEVVQGKKLTVKTYDEWTANLADSCQVIILSEQGGDNMQEILAFLADKSVLTIGENPEFLQKGGIIRFVIIDDTVQFEVNLATAKQARLVISSKLLRLANNVLTFN
ncbi:MAG TPA: YfiR family protein [Gammaproteobacteria bacterium]